MASVNQLPHSRPASTAAALAKVLRRPLASYYLVLGAAGLLLLLGLVMVFSASSVISREEHGTALYYFARQVGWVVAALPLAFIVTRLRPQTMRRFATLGLVLAVALLILTFVPRFGVEVNGNRNWLSFGGPVRIQPSELAKLALIIWGAHVYAANRKHLDEWRSLFVPFVPVAIAVTGLTIGQQDLGTALIIMAIVLTFLWVVGVPTWAFSLGLGVVGLVSLYFITGSQNRTTRVLNFLDPFENFEGAGYQAGNSIWAFANGGWWGTGLGASTQKWPGRLPEAHTDFIFAIVGEELGLPGALIVVALFLVLGYAGVRIAMRTRDIFIRLAAAGITGWLMVQMIINMGSVLAVFPVVGVPLPLVSYGGASIVVTVVAVAVLMALAKEEPGARDALAARQRARLERRDLRRAERRDSAATGGRTS
jgi:cell division protein FtsW